MEVDEEWEALVAEIRAAPEPMTCRATERLWKRALDLCRPILASFREIPEDERDALINYVFTEKLHAFVAPTVTDTRSFLAGTVKLRAIDEFRKGRVRRAAEAPLAAMAAWAQQVAGGEGERVLSIDQARALAALPERDREIILAVFMGEERDDVARFFGTTRANVDQKIARFRKQHREGE